MSEEDALVMADWFSSKAPRTLTLTITKWSTRLEDGCASCVTKHLAQAIELFGNSAAIKPHVADVLYRRAAILLHEAQHGYPGHRYHAIGCLAEAENYVSPDEARSIRRVRIEVARDLGVGELKTYCDDVLEIERGGNVAEAWAHVSEAFMELPEADTENRDALRQLLIDYGPAEGLVQKLAKVLKNVADTYCLPGGDL